MATTWHDPTDLVTANDPSDPSGDLLRQAGPISDTQRAAWWYADDLLPDLPPGIPADDYGVRSCLLHVARIDREEARIKALLATITAEYRQHLDRLDSQRRELRGQVRAFLLTHDMRNLRIPDVGTAYLRKVPANVEVTDGKAFDAWALQCGHTKTVASHTKAKEAALAMALESGELAPGVKLHKEGQGLSVKLGRPGV